MKTSKFLSINWSDIIKGLIISIITPAIVVVQQSLDLGILTFEFKSMLTASIGGGLAYVIKNFLTPQHEIKQIEHL